RIYTKLLSSYSDKLSLLSILLNAASSDEDTLKILGASSLKEPQEYVSLLLRYGKAYLQRPKLARSVIAYCQWLVQWRRQDVEDPLNVAVKKLLLELFQSASDPHKEILLDLA